MFDPNDDETIHRPGFPVTEDAGRVQANRPGSCAPALLPLADGKGLPAYSYVWIYRNRNCPIVSALRHIPQVAVWNRTGSVPEPGRALSNKEMSHFSHLDSTLDSIR
jgi:hypothetical protein